MNDDPQSGSRQGRNSGFRPHEFGWDPLERVRLAWKGRPFGRTATILAAALVSAVAIGGAVMGAGQDARDADASVRQQEGRLAALDGEVKQRERQVAELERRRTAAEAEIADSKKRIASLEDRRADLQRQVAELTGPVAQPDSELGGTAGSRGAPSADHAAAAIDDSSPPDEAPSASGAEVSASSRPATGEAAPSSAEIDPAVETVSVDAANAGGHVRVFIHVRSSDAAARERARAVAAELERRGVEVAEIRGVVRPVRRDAVRFFYDADREAASALQDAIRLAAPPNGPAPQSQDFRGYRAPPKPGVLELWLS